MFPFFFCRDRDSNNLNAARMSAAAEGSTEAILYLRNAQMQTNPSSSGWFFCWQRMNKDSKGRHGSVNWRADVVIGPYGNNWYRENCSVLRREQAPALPNLGETDCHGRIRPRNDTGMMKHCGLTPLR